DQIGARVGEPRDRLLDVRDLVGDVVHPGAALGEEATDGRVLGERLQQLDAASSDPERRGLDALVGNRRALLELSPEETFAGRQRRFEIVDRDTEMMDPAGLHPPDAIRRGRPGGRSRYVAEMIRGVPTVSAERDSAGTSR